MEPALESLSRRMWIVHSDEVQETISLTTPEEPLSLHVDGRQIAILMRLPGMEKELAAGFLISEGLVKDSRDIWVLRHCGQGLPEPGEATSDDGAVESRNRVEVHLRPGALDEQARLDVVRLIRAGCGAVDVERAELPLEPLPADTISVEIKTLLAMPRSMRENQSLRREFGGVHAAALFDERGELLVLAEDVGRHNAVDKVIGSCLLRDIPLSDKILLCSGRLSYEMVTKAIRARIPVVASMSAATTLGIQIADTFGLTLIGYLRGERMTIYAHPERVIVPQ